VLNLLYVPTYSRLTLRVLPSVVYFRAVPPPCTVWCSLVSTDRSGRQGGLSVV